MTASDSKLQSFTLAESILESIESCEREMSAVSEAVLQKTNRKKSFQEALLLQLSGILVLSSLQNTLPIGMRYALMLASSIFDHLLQGWCANLQAYYRVSLSLLRIINESTVFEVAVSVDDNALQQWLSGKLWKMNEVRNIVQRFLTNMSGEVIAKAWAANQKKIWKDLNALAHASWKGVAAPAARVRSTSGVPLYSPAGRIFNPTLCLDLSLHYIKAATDAVVAMRLAFSPYLEREDQWFDREKKYLSAANAELLRECKVDELLLRHVKETLGESRDV